MNTKTGHVEVDYQLALTDAAVQDCGPIPTEQQIQEWVNATLTTLEFQETAQLTVRIVDVEEMTELNQTYRHKTGATNVLSFPFETPQGIPEDEMIPFLGDIIVCASVVRHEAEQQQKPVLQHWAHMIVHGILHLLGYDHISAPDAEKMEGLEVQVLSTLGITDPYLSQ